MSLQIRIRTNAWPGMWSDCEPCEPALAQRAAEVLLEWLMDSARAHWPQADVSGEVECFQPVSTTRIVDVTYGDAERDAQDYAALNRIAEVVAHWQEARWVDALQEALDEEDDQAAA